MPRKVTFQRKRKLKQLPGAGQRTEILERIALIFSLRIAWGVKIRRNLAQTITAKSETAKPREGRNAHSETLAIRKLSYCPLPTSGEGLGVGLLALSTSPLTPLRGAERGTNAAADQRKLLVGVPATIYFANTI